MRELTEERFKNVHSLLEDIRISVRELRKDIDEARLWRSGTEEVLDSIIERIDLVVDQTDKLSNRADGYQRFIDHFEGGRAGVAHIIVTISSVVGMLVAITTLLKVFKIF